MMNWEQLLSLKRFGDTNKRLRKEQDDTRLGFEVDYDRIIFSSSFRSLQDKTQVIPLSKTDFVHTRLTHSLEVSVVGRSLGRVVGKKLLEKHPHLSKTYGHHFNDFGAIVAAASLAHDIGNPPFGHSGEKAIGDFFKSGKGNRFKDSLTNVQYQDLCTFEGNANGFKLLTETKNGVTGGLRLSYSTLGAFMKYPKASLPYKPTTQIHHKKYGYFQSEQEVFNDVVKDLGLISETVKDSETYKRHPLTFLVEAADDICYTIIDFEDGINLGLIDEEFALEYLINLVKDKIDTKKYHQLVTKSNRVSYLRALAIGVLIEEAASIFIANEEAILKGYFSSALLDKSQYTAQIDDIIKISINNVYQSQDVLEKEILGYQVIGTLLKVYTDAVFSKKNNTNTNFNSLILKGFLKEFDLNQDDYSILIEISSLVASYSDSEALRIYQKIKGML
jgi:dGTPase